MKKLFVVITTIMLTACGISIYDDVRPIHIDIANKKCEPNGGLRNIGTAWTVIDKDEPVKSYQSVSFTCTNSAGFYLRWDYNKEDQK